MIDLLSNKTWLLLRTKQALDESLHGRNRLTAKAVRRKIEKTRSEVVRDGVKFHYLEGTNADISEPIK